MEPETAAFPPLPPIFSGRHPLQRYHILCVLENNFGRIHKNILARFLAGVSLTSVQTLAKPQDVVYDRVDVFG